MKYPYDHPGIYAIYVAGRVDTDWVACSGGLTVMYEYDPNGDPISILKGLLPDQAALVGILTTLYNARYPILFVTYLRPEQETSSQV